MKRIEIPLKKLEIESFKALKSRLLITCGKNVQGEYNSMTVDWGFFGVIWGRPCVILTVRPSRYTYEFIEKHSDFSVSMFSPNYRDILLMMGKKSGRNSQKMSECGLTPIDSKMIVSPSFKEATYALECRKILVSEINKEEIIAEDIIKEWYPEGDYHKVIIGEIVAAFKDM